MRAISAGNQCYHACMRKQAREVQYTVRGIPPDVDRALRRKAANRNQSLNQVIVDELTLATRSGRSIRTSGSEGRA